MKIFRQSLRSKLIGVFLLPTLVIVALYGFLAYFASRQGLEEELGKRLVSIGETISADMSEGFDAKQVARLDATKGRVITRLRQDLEAARERTGVRRVYLFDQAHTSLVDTSEGVEFGARLYELEPHGAEIAKVFEQNEAATSVLFEGPDGLPYKSGFVPVTQDGEVVAALGVEASAEYFDLLTNFASVLTVLAILAIFLVVLAGTVFSRRLVRPINQLVRAAQRVGRGEWDEPVDVRAEGDEIAFLAGAFEEMRRDIVSRDRQMQMMLSGIAHEVRNPLGGMELFCGLLAEDLHAGDFDGEEAEMLEKVKKIQRELDYLERVVTDFLDFARDITPDLERFPAAELIHDLNDLLDAEVQGAGCAIETTIEPETVELTADRQKLRRALINVVRNAYQACGEGGHIEIAVRTDGPSRRIIEVSDDGPGIDQARIDEVLTPFYTTKEKGSGLGLALSQRILEQHDGTLQIDSDADQGTTVRFVLRYDPDVDRAAPEVPEGWLG